MKNTNMNGKSLNPQEELLELLHQKFPEVFTEGNVDCQKLKQTLGESVDIDSERYSMTWAGKNNCFRVIQESTTATLKPAKDESVDFDNTENLFIEGDNLEVLKILQKPYYGKVKMIYIDPPYNTGNDFIYNDDFKQNKSEYEEQAGIKDEDGNHRSDGLIKNSKDRGHYHSDWLNMMYPRLFLARNLLRQDGVIFVSIDDNEVHNLKMMMNEIFGEENYICEFIWKNKKGGGNDSKFIAVENEYVLLYGKSIQSLGNMFHQYDDEYKKRYKEEDEHGLFFWDTFKRKSGKQYYPITCPDGTVLEKDEFGNPISWLRSEARFYEDLKIGEVKIIKIGNEWSVQFKQRMPEGKKPRSILDNFGTTSTGSSECFELFQKHVFQNPKPTRLIKHFLDIIAEKNDLILDFFAGSGTTAHAVMQLNAEDGGNRKCISVQLPELCDKKSEAFKAGYKTIADISKERIRRAGNKIKEEQGKQLDFEGNKLDTGFKVFKLDESNFKIWRTDIADEKTLLEQMNMFVDNVKEESTQDNILYELILKSGLDLNAQVTKKEADKKTYFVIDEGSLVICLEAKITQALLDAILADKPQKVICLDKAFGGNDQLKTNTLLQMESAKIDFKVI